MYFLLANQLLDFTHFARKRGAQVSRAVFSHHQRVLNAHANVFFREVDSGLDGDHHAGLQWPSQVAGIVYVQAHVVAQAMREILPQRLAMGILAVRVDVIVRDLVQRPALATKMDTGLYRRDRSLLGS